MRRFESCRGHRSQARSWTWGDNATTRGRTCRQLRRPGACACGQGSAAEPRTSSKTDASRCTSSTRSTDVAPHGSAWRACCAILANGTSGARGVRLRVGGTRPARAPAPDQAAAPSSVDGPFRRRVASEGDGSEGGGRLGQDQAQPAIVVLVRTLSCASARPPKGAARADGRLADVRANSPRSSYTTFAAAIVVSSAWSYAGATSTTSPPTRFEPVEASQDQLKLPSGQATGFRRAGPRCVRRIQARRCRCSRRPVAGQLGCGSGRSPRRHRACATSTVVTIANPSALSSARSPTE